MHRVSDSRVEFRVRHPFAWHFGILLIAAGGELFIYIDKHPIAEAVIALLVGMGFSFFVWLVAPLLVKPVVFDKRLGLFWEGRRQPDQIVDTGSSKCLGRIADIHALQTISTYRVVEGNIEDRKEFITYQLNLIMKDGTRLLVSGEDDTASLHRDAEGLSRFLERPWWDAC